MKRAVAGICLVLAGILVFLVIWPSHRTILPPKRLDKLIVGKEVEYGTLFSVAKEQGFFAQNGLDVTLREYSSGAPAFADMLAGKIDMTDAAEFVGVLNSFSGNNFKILASLGTTTDSWELIGRADHGIAKESDFKGKKIGVPQGTLGEFFLGNFLILNQVLPEDVTLVYLSPQDLMTALTAGTIDGAMIFQPYAFNLEQRLGKNAIRFAAQSDRNNYILLYANSHVVNNRPDVVRRFLGSLIEAQTFLEHNPSQLAKFMKTGLGYSDAYIQSVISHFKFYVGLEQPMLPLMEDEARWAIDTKLTPMQTVPNYLPFIYFTGLDSVNPKTITIIR